MKRKKTKIAQRSRHQQPPLRRAVPPTLTPQVLRTFPPELRATVQRALAQRPPCLLCGREASTLGIFDPAQPRRWGIPDGWHGRCVYALCPRCLQRPDAPDLVEAVLWQDRAQASAPWN